MSKKHPYDLEKIKRQGLEIGIGRRVRSGRLLRLKGLRKTARGLSNRPLLGRYSEVEIVGLNGGLSLFIPTKCLTDNPHIILAYHEATGCAILIGVIEAIKGHLLLMGLTQAGKSSVMGLIAYQLIRLGYFCVYVGMKAWDPVVVGYLRAASESKTRIDEKGKLSSAPFAHYTLQPNTKTRGVNCVAQKHFRLPRWLQSAILRRSMGPSEGEKHPERRYFETSEQAALQKMPAWGSSYRELRVNFDKVKQTTEQHKATSGLRNELEQLAEIEQANLPLEHPANIDIAKLLKQKGVILFDACYQDTGSVGTANAADFVQTLIFIKRQIAPDRNLLIFIFVDECQKFFLSLMAQIIEQVAGFGIRMVLSCHNHLQLNDFSETISMTQGRVFFSAVPGGETDRHIQNLFGTTKEFVPSLSAGDNTSKSNGVSFGPSGVSYSSNTSTGAQHGISLTEHETQAWPLNRTH